MILQRPRDDLRSRCRIPIHEYDHRQIGDSEPLLRHEALLLSVARPHSRDLLSFFQEQIADRERLVEDPARIVAEVENEGLSPLLPQLFDRLGQFLGCGLVERLQWYVSDAAVEQKCVRHRRHVNEGAGKAVLDRLGNSGTREPRSDLGTWRAGERLGNRARAPAAGRGRVHADDPVALDDSRSFSRCIRKYPHYHDVALLLLDLHADTAVPSRRRAGETLRLLWREQLGVRIIELGHEPAGGLFEKGRRVDGIYEPFRYKREHLVEKPCVLSCAAILKNKTAGEDGQGNGGG